MVITIIVIMIIIIIIAIAIIFINIVIIVVIIIITYEFVLSESVFHGCRIRKEYPMTFEMMFSYEHFHPIFPPPMPDDKNANHQ